MIHWEVTIFFLLGPHNFSHVWPMRETRVLIYEGMKIRPGQSSWARKRQNNTFTIRSNENIKYPATVFDIKFNVMSRAAAL